LHNFCAFKNWQQSVMQQNMVIPPWDQLPALPWKEKLAYLTLQFSRMEQAECQLTHKFEQGLYIRELRMPAGTLLIGRVHRYGHVCQLLEGDLILIHCKGVREGFKAPSQILTEPGYQMVVYAATDALARTVHPNPREERDIQRLEDDIFESKEDLLRLGQQVEERVLYERMMIDMGIDEEALRPMIEDESDQIEFPEHYPVCVGESPLHGRGVIATDRIVAGSRIAPARIGNKRTPAGRYTNHGSNPNAQMKRSDSGDIELVSISDIAPGAEILVDYRHAFQVGKL
jgi:hypothetical protein